jgi:hypothetical protein
MNVKRIHRLVRLCEHGRVTNSRLRAASVLVVLLLGIAGCDQAASQQSGSTAQHPQVTARHIASHAVSGSELPPRCARREPPRIPPNRWPPTRSKLAPFGAVAIRLCPYGQLPDVALLRRSPLLTTPSLIKRLLVRFDELPTPPLHVHCPMDNGSEIVALLSYPGGQQVTVTVRRTGCAETTNGNLVRSASGFATPNPSGPQLRDELRRLILTSLESP